MYLQYYQLAQKPFQINTDPAFLWFGEKHKEALATLKYGILENKSFLLLTGDVGVGKTTIINALLEVLDKNDLVAVINDPMLDKLDFFTHIAKAFGLSGNCTTKGHFLITFGKFLLEQHYQGKRILLIVDESQLLSHELLEEIRLFSNLEKNGTKLINIFFVGQLELNDILLLPENKAIRQRITVNYNIPPLSFEETEKYIEYRLAVAGATRKIFDKSAIREIFHFSKGYPRLINVLADRALLTGFIASNKHIGIKIIKECALELDISSNNTQLHSNTQSRNQEKRSRGNRHAALRYIGYAVIVCLLFILAYLPFTYITSHSSAPFFPPYFSKIQALLPAGINKKQEDIPPEAPPEPPPTHPAPPENIVIPGNIPAAPPVDISVAKTSAPVPPASPAPSEDIVIPDNIPESPGAALPLAQERTSLDKTVFPADNTVEGLDTERPLGILVISFASDSLEISSASLAELEKFADAVVHRKNAKILIRGYTDSSGSILYNKKLAGFRASSVKNILAGKGIPIDRISIASDENTTDDTAGQGTRRVEVEVLPE